MSTLTIYQWVAVLAAVIIAYSFRKRKSYYSRKLTRAVSVVLSKPWHSIALVGGLGFILSILVSCVRFPVPAVHDEFSQLLAADTFRQGRVTNPTHPLWVHFESFHVIHKPSYATKYPPAQGLLMALGTFLGGHPIVGVWLSTAFASAAFCWMLHGWVPRRWAVLGGLLVALHTGIQFQWGQSYWGGALAMTGGALMFGAYRRIIKQVHLKDTLLLVLGVVLLANTRPFEGFAACVPVAFGLSYWILRGENRPSLKTCFAKFLLPGVSVLTIAACMMLYYNFRVTGDALKMPYRVHEETYAVAPLFLWKDFPDTPKYRHQVMEDFQLGWALEGHRIQKNLFDSFKEKRGVPYFFLTPALTLPLLAIPWIFRRRETLFVIGTFSLVFFSTLFVPWLFPHYLAPVAPLLFLLVVQGIRYLRVWTVDGQRCGRLLVVNLLLVHAIFFFITLWPHAASSTRSWAQHREQLKSTLGQQSGQHLVIVRYDERHSPHDEWVYNEADIDRAKIVWAREMDIEQNRRLVNYFRKRQIWLLHADSTPLKIEKYSLSADPGKTNQADNLSLHSR